MLECEVKTEWTFGQVSYLSTSCVSCSSFEKHHHMPTRPACTLTTWHHSGGELKIEIDDVDEGNVHFSIMQKIIQGQRKLESKPSWWWDQWGWKPITINIQSRTSQSRLTITPSEQNRIALALTKSTGWMAKQVGTFIYIVTSPAITNPTDCAIKYMEEHIDSHTFTV